MAWCGQGQGEGEGGSVSGAGAGGGQGAALRGGQGAGDGRSDAAGLVVAWAGGAPVEPLEQEFAVLGWESAAGVGDGEDCGGGVVGDGDGDGVCGLAVVQGVVQQLVEDFGEAVGIRLCGDRVCEVGGVQGDLLGGVSGGGRGGGGVGGGGEVDRLGAEQEGVFVARETAVRSSIRRESRRDCRVRVSRVVASTGRTPSVIASTVASMDANGVRSSWARSVSSCSRALSLSSSRWARAFTESARSANSEHHPGWWYAGGVVACGQRGGLAVLVMGLTMRRATSAATAVATRQAATTPVAIPANSDQAKPW